MAGDLNVTTYPIATALVSLFAGERSEYKVTLFILKNEEYSFSKERLKPNRRKKCSSLARTGQLQFIHSLRSPEDDQNKRRCH